MKSLKEIGLFADLPDKEIESLGNIANSFVIKKGVLTVSQMHAGGWKRDNILHPEA